MRQPPPPAKPAEPTYREQGVFTWPTAIAVVLVCCIIGSYIVLHAIYGR